MLANGELHVTAWEELRSEDLGDGRRVVHGRLEDALSGGFEGTASWDNLLFYRADGSASFVTLGQMRGRLGDREGSFAVATRGTYDGEWVRSSWAIVVDSGTGELTGISGTGELETQPGHPGVYSLEVELPN
jgi:uncharacterized protein DUF3224